MQPWKVHVVTGAARDRLCNDIVEAHREGASHSGEYQYYPKEFFEPFKSRRRAVGWALYGLLDIKKGDFEKTKAQHARNFTFFDAPVGLIFTIHRGLEIGSWLDFGMFMENVMIIARSHGLETCPQAAFATYHKIIRAHLDLAEEDVVVAGMALGKADWSKIENTLITERMALEDYVRFHRG
jgi:nitroreductase